MAAPHAARVTAREIARLRGRDVLLDDRALLLGNPRPRVIPLSPALAAALTAHRDRRAQLDELADPDGLVFMWRDGGPVRGRWISDGCAGYLRAAGVTGATAALRRLPELLAAENI